MSFSVRHKLYIQAIAFVCALSGFAYLGWLLFGYITAAAEEAATAQKELAQLDAEQRQISEIAKEYEEVKPALPSLERLLLPREEKLSFIMLVERLVKEAGIAHIIDTVEDVSAASSAKTKGQDAVVFNINVRGEFSRVMRFAYLLENDQYYLTLEKIHITRATESVPLLDENGAPLSVKDAVKMQLSVKVYAQ